MLIATVYMEVKLCT